MPRNAAWLAAVMLALCSAATARAPASAQDICAENPPYRSVIIDGEAYGRRGFERAMGDGLTFGLEAVEHGWQIQISDDSGQNLALVTPPLRMPQTNPTAILGWHFRNAANTGANEGDVNAPQLRRRFVFGEQAMNPEFNPELIVPGAPGHDPGAPPAAPTIGAGELEIIEFGLTDLDEGGRARMNYLLFQVCLQWLPADGAAETPADPIPDRIAAAIARCGLPEGYELSDHITRQFNQPAYLEPDIDGDGETDVVAPLSRRVGGQIGLGVCVTGADAFELVGFDAPLGRHLTPEYFGRFDYWGVHDGPEVQQGVAEGSPPVLVGDAILLGIEGASSVLVFRTGQEWSSYWQGD